MNKSLPARLLGWRARILAALAVIGPGIITANADNDAGGISTYSIVGAHYGYSLLWVLVLVTISLAVTQEMGARTGAATGKGLAALIRERYGVRWTVRPPWDAVFRAMVTPSFQMDAGYLLVFVATVGTTITPWGQFFIQAYVVDKGIGPREYPATRFDVLVGAFVTDIVSFFIIVTTASTLYVSGIRIESAAEAARALEPLAGPLAQYLFAVGLLNASLLAASILPLATAYTICEAFGWESGVDREWREAPAFHTLYTFAIVLGALVALIPGLPLFPVMLFSQDVNGILLVVVLIFAIRIANDPVIMGAHVNGRIARPVAWITATALIVLTVLLVVASIAQLLGIPIG